MQPLNASAVDALMQFIPAVQIVSLQILSFDRRSGDPIERVMSHPAIQRHLRILCIDKPSADEVALAVARLPLLRALDLIGPVSSILCASLVDAPSLTSLCVMDGLKPEDSVIPLLIRLPHLRILSIHAPRLNAQCWLPFCAAMSQLEELNMEKWSDWHSATISPEDMAAGFVRMRALQRISLRECDKLASLLRALTPLQTLRRLTVRSKAVLVARLHALFESNSELRVRVELMGSNQIPGMRDQFPDQFSERLSVVN